ncbi:hypothetical protein [Owenweeksia hongkongensis]|uniref:hypothetical protein n=1 Tax=Owenweeksia hongkongensis TaxID=253245 RepID=UPI00030C6022|nr:hypothetical protein [Owenweeksia hongkongensis]
MAKTPEQKLMELEQKVRLLEKQKKQLKHQIERAGKKAIIFDVMIDIVEKEYNIPIRKKLLTRTVKQYKEHYQESITAAYRLFGYSRQVFYRAIKAEKTKQQCARKVVSLVQEKRMTKPRLGTRKLYHLLQPELQALDVGRDKLFLILKANHMLIQPKKSYHITTNSYHRFRKHKNLIADLPINRPEQLWMADITYVGTRENPMSMGLVTMLSLRK